MGTNIFEKIRSDQAHDEQTTLKNYFAFPAKLDADNASDADAAKLATFLRTLNRTPNQAEKDRAAVANVANLVHVIDATKDAAERAARLHEEHLKVCAERQKLTAEMNAKVAAVTGEKLNAEADR